MLESQMKLQVRGSELEYDPCPGTRRPVFTERYETLHHLLC